MPCPRCSNILSPKQGLWMLIDGVQRYPDPLSFDVSYMSLSKLGQITYCASILLPETSTWAHKSRQGIFVAPGDRLDGRAPKAGCNNSQFSLGCQATVRGVQRTPSTIETSRIRWPCPIGSSKGWQTARVRGYPPWYKSASSLLTPRPGKPHSLVLVPVNALRHFQLRASSTLLENDIFSP